MQAFKSLQQKRNLDHLTQARSNQLFCNANRAKDAEILDDIAIFLPHPIVWQACSVDRVLQIDRATAIEFLRTYKRYSPEVEIVFADWLQEIVLIAQG